MSEFVRRATADDAAVLAALDQAYRAAVGGVERGGPQLVSALGDSDAALWRRRIDDDAWVVVVGGLDAVVLGMGALELPPAASTGRISVLWVEPGAREIGLGEAVLAALMEGARELGAARIEAVALPGDRETKNLYERAGLVARLIVVDAEL